MSTENALLTILVEKIKNDSLVLPTLPEIAVKVRETADDPDVNLAKMGEVIAQDPALSVRIIKVANSAYLGRTVKVETLNQAVNRIGLRQIKNIATALAMEQLFISKNEIVREFFDKHWSDTVKVAAAAITALSRYKKVHKHAALNLDTITLAALIYNIGALPILTEAEKHADVFANPTFLEQAIGQLSGRLGAKIMKAWGFGDEFVSVAQDWNKESFNPNQATYSDFIRIGAYHAGVLTENKVKVITNYADHGFLDSPDILTDDEFNAEVGDAKKVFA